MAQLYNFFKLINKNVDLDDSLIDMFKILSKLHYDYELEKKGLFG